jgi:hypothetical protein
MSETKPKVGGVNEEIPVTCPTKITHTRAAAATSLRPAHEEDGSGKGEKQPTNIGD